MSPLVEAKRVSKAFPGVQALQGVDLHVMPGEVLAVVGENGAGKSTLMKILGGVQRADSGAIAMDGQPVAIRSVKDAERLGIVLIHQELNLAGDLDVAANVFLGREPTWGGPLRMVRSSIYRDAESLTRRMGLECSPRTPVANLTVGQQQLVEIAKALSLKSRLLILDEPTSSLTESETARLFGVLDDLKRDGIGVLYISHRLKEVETIADRVTVLRDGRNAGELLKGAIKHHAIVRLMVGRELKQFYPRSRELAGDAKPVVEVDGLRWNAKQPPLKFAIRPGEIVGMAGLMGAGRTELAETLFGVRPMLAGTVRVDGAIVRVRKPADAIAAGVFLVPEDRRVEGLILGDAIQRNISLPILPTLCRFGLVQRPRERQLADELCKRLQVRTPSVDQIVGNLSGGNQQKVVIAKWLSRSPRLLILDEPTRGVDVGAKSEIYALLDELARSGVAILMISSDLEEVLGVSDRVLVMHQGEISGELRRAELSEEAIMRLATGGASSS